MRDLRGDATRAKVDISMIQVPEYQVGSGRDQANQSFTGAKARTPVALQAEQAEAARRSGANAPSPNPLPKGAKLISTTDKNGVLTKRYKLTDGSTYIVKEGR
jgi:hypothetical protein